MSQVQNEYTNGTHFLTFHPNQGYVVFGIIVNRLDEPDWYVILASCSCYESMVKFDKRHDGNYDVRFNLSDSHRDPSDFRKFVEMIRSEGVMDFFLTSFRDRYSE